ncbi:MAG: aldo/keto reductase [Thermoguttaceae bacterium]|jgi:predicted aldo/keto reductase-like oxidoreductase
MNYRTLGKTDTKLSALGFGAMRLPTKGNEADVDEAQAVEMIRYAIDQGVNYVDTAYVYHGGNGEGAVGKALAGGYREKVHLATKLPVWSVQQVEDCDPILNEQLVRLQTDHIDFYLLHCLQEKSWQKMRDLGVPQWAEKAQSDGRIGHFGFSFHDTYDTLVGILDDYDWSFCQIQYNFVNEDVQAGTKGLKYAAAKGLGVIVMEPLFGGTLANPPQPVWEIWNNNHHRYRPADVALRWLWDKPEVSMVLSGMGSLAQVKQNIDSACRSGVGWLDEHEATLVARVQQEYAKLSPIPCTKCGYCMPCPNGVNIPVNFELYNNAAVFEGSSIVLCRNLYNSLPEAERAKVCAACGVCQEKCPQGIEIGKMMGLVREQFQ